MSRLHSPSFVRSFGAAADERERVGRASPRLASTTAALLLVALLLGITTPAAAAKELQTVRFVTAGPAMTTLPMEVAVEKGFDKEEGFTSAFTQSGGAIGVKALIAGDFDFGLSAGSALAAAVTGAPVKVIYLHVAKPLFFLYAREGIDNVKSLEGARIGVDAIGGSQDVAVRIAMRAVGADAAKATFLAMGFQNIPGSLIAGAIDAGVIAPPLEFQLAKSGKKFKDLGFLGDYVPSVSGGVATGDAVIHDHADMVRAVLRAHAKAHRFILEHRDETIAIITKFLRLTHEEAASTYDSIVPQFTKSGAVSLDEQKKLIAAQAAVLKIAKAPEPQAIFDFSFVPQK